MRKLIDIPDDIVKPLKILAINADKDLKKYQKMNGEQKVIWLQLLKGL